MDGPARLVEHLRREDYHPRSDAHSNQVCQGFLTDLLATSSLAGARAVSGRLVAKLNLTVIVQHARWKIDLALGPPPGEAVPASGGEPIRLMQPAAIQIAMEAKAVMTEHKKARYNRLRDLEAFHAHAHNYNPKVIAVGLVIVNASEFFWSPTRKFNDVTQHRNIPRLIQETIETYRSLRLRHRPQDESGLEALGVIVVRHDNLAANPHLPEDAPEPQSTRLVSSPPAPQVGDPLHYASMIHRVSAAYEERWS